MPAPQQHQPSLPFPATGRVCGLVAETVSPLHAILAPHLPGVSRLSMEVIRSHALRGREVSLPHLVLEGCSMLL